MSVRQSDDTNRTGISLSPTVKVWVKVWVKVCDESAVIFLREFLLVLFQPLQQNRF